MSGNGHSATMKLFRLVADKTGDSPCRMPHTVTTPIVDAGPVYGPSEDFLQNVLREPGTCKLRTSAGNFVPVTTRPEEATGKHFFVAGDVRVNEHSVLTSMHTVWLREHNRLCNILGWHPRTRRLSEDEKFDKPNEFSIRWEGSLLPADSGTYTIIVRTEHAIRLWLNDDRQALIDGYVQSGPSVLNGGGDPLFNLAAEAAMRAVNRCQPYVLPAEKYDLWRDINVTFDPREMLRG